MRIRLSLLLVGTLVFSGCNRMVVGIVGMHPYDHEVTWKKKDRIAKRMGIVPSEYLVLQHRYARRVEQRRGHEPDKHVQAKYQPIQLRWYSSGGRMQWLIPNCDVGGFPNLQWSHFGLPDTLFVPLTSRAYADSSWTVTEDLGYMTEREGGLPPSMEVNDRGHLLVYWTYFMGRQSVRLGRYIEKWRKKQGFGVDVRFVNADSLLIGFDRPEVE